MTVIARGAAQVRAYERAIGGDPPDATFQRVQDSLAQRVTQRAELQQRNSEERDRIASSFTEHLVTPVLTHHPELRTQLESLTTGRPEGNRTEYKLRPPAFKKVESQVATPAAIQLIKAPPYDWDWSSVWPGPSQNLSTFVDKNTGAYTVYALSEGKSGYATAALGIWFYATADNPTQRFSALIQYTDIWGYAAVFSDTSCFVETWLEVWGHTENAWVGTASVQPNLQRGGSYLDRANNYPDGDSGTAVPEIYFPVNANNWYLGVIRSLAFGVTGSSIAGTGYAQMSLEASIPFVTFGKLDF